MPYGFPTYAAAYAAGSLLTERAPDDAFGIVQANGRHLIAIASRETGLPVRTVLDSLSDAGVQAERDGVKWWNNPHPAGSVAAYEWDKGHTAARTIRAAQGRRA